MNEVKMLENILDITKDLKSVSKSFATQNQFNKDFSKSIVLLAKVCRNQKFIIFF